MLDLLLRQFDTAWKLATYHLDGLTTAECLWRPAPLAPHVHRLPDASWQGDWPDREGYDIGPPSIAWITWHIEFWWSMVLDHSFGSRTLARQDIRWAGDADAARAWIIQLHDRWRAALERLSDDDLRSSRLTAWPYENRPFGDVVAWLNMELTKNASEIGYARFLYAVRSDVDTHEQREG